MHGKPHRRSGAQNKEACALSAFVLRGSMMGLTRKSEIIILISMIYGGAARRIRTSLTKGSMAVPYAAQRPRHSARAAARLALKRCRLERLRSWLKWFRTEAWTEANF